MFTDGFLHCGETLIDRLLQRRQACFIGIGELDQLLRKAVDLIVLHRGDIGHLRAKRLPELRHALGNFLPVGLRTLFDFAAQLTLDALVGGIDTVEALSQFFNCGTG